MNIISSTWSPLREWEDVHGRILRSFAGAGSCNGTAGWIPAADIAEDGGAYLIDLELPEVDRADVKVSLENGVLTISGERRLREAGKDRRYHRVERRHGAFSRSFALPDDTDADRVSAGFKDGVLRVVLPKSDSAKPRRIEIAEG